MNFIETTKFLTKLKEGLGDDLLYSLALDSGKWVVTVSTQNSNRIYKAGGEMRSCTIEENDYNTDYEIIVNIIINMFKPLLVSRLKERDGV